MIFELLFTVFAVQQSVAGIILDKATNSALKTWSSYRDGNSDIQKALRAAFLHTVAAIIPALQNEKTWLPKLPPSQLNKEFAEMIEADYLIPFCQSHRVSPDDLRKIAKKNGKILKDFFNDEQKFPFRKISVEEVSSLLYNARFITDETVLHEQKELAVDAMKENIKQNAEGIDTTFLEFLFFAGKNGSCILYDGVLFFFEDEIKRKDEVAKKLAHFDRQQVRKDIAELSSKVDDAVKNRQWQDVGKLGSILEKMDASQKVWESAEQQFQSIHQKFEQINALIREHFDELQKWLETEFEDVKEKVETEGEKTRGVVEIEGEDTRGHVSRETNRVIEAVRHEFRQLGLADDIAINENDFQAVPNLWSLYESLQSLGEGGLADVYKVRNKKVKSTRALKVLKVQHINNSQIIARFWAEGRITGMLGSPEHNIVRVTNMGRTRDNFYFIEMEYVPGQPMSHILQRKGKFEAMRALRLLKKLAIALQYSHENNVIHRDLKPQNIMIGSKDKLTLMDFGLAKRLDSNSIVSMPGLMIGTPFYAAPEQFDPDKFGNITPATDVYSTGILLYQMLTNELPFEGSEISVAYCHCHKPLPELPDDIPSEIKALVNKCTQKKPEDRYPDMTTLRGAIEKILQAEAVEDYRVLYAPFAGTKINSRARRSLEKQREALELSQAAVELVESEMNQAAQEKIEAERKRKASEERRRQKAAEQKRIEAELEQKAAEKKTPAKEITKHGIDLVYVPGGRFEMGDLWGDGDDDESPVHTVELDGFYMGKYEVTNAQYAQFLNEYGSDRVKEGEYKGKTMIYESDASYNANYNWGLNRVNGQWQPVEGYANHPVIFVTWYGAYEFCRYYGFQLPTEAQWEYAARSGGKKEKWSGTSDENELTNYAWYDDNSDDHPHEVGTRLPNGLGLYDLSGNVWEWCLDWYDGEYYQKLANKVSKNPIDTNESSARVLRGGSWNNNPRLCRVASRDRSNPDDGDLNLGFRVVCFVAVSRTP